MLKVQKYPVMVPDELIPVGNVKIDPGGSKLVMTPVTAAAGTERITEAASVMAKAERQDCNGLGQQRLRNIYDLR